ncbi:MAG: HD domain-containing protein [Eubacteriales bacterium]|nr:HD domain-containing protein [Eubacteriales bacterium]
MPNSNKDFRKIILVRLVAFAIAAVIFMLLYVGLIMSGSAAENNTGQLVNILGRQRMLTQQMAKDSNRVFALVQAQYSGTTESPQEIIEQAKSDSRKSLQIAITEFDQVITGAVTGYFKLENSEIKLDAEDESLKLIVDSISQKWQAYKNAVQTIIDLDTYDSKLAEAIIYINANNIELMQQSDDFTNQIISKQSQIATNNNRLAYIVLGISLLILLGGMFWLYQFIIYPLDELYHQLSLNGLGGVSSRRHRIPLGRTSREMISEVSSAFDRLRSLIKLIENVNKNVSFEEVLQFIYMTFSAYVPYSYIGIALLKENDTVLEASYGICGNDLTTLRENLEGTRIEINKTSLENIIANNEVRLINDYSSYMRGKKIRPYSQFLLDAGIKSSITLPLSSNERKLGIIFFSSTQKDAYDENHLAFLQTLTNSIGISFEKSIFIDQLLYSSILAMARLTEARDEDTGDHLERIKHYSRTIAIWLREAGFYRDILTTAYIDDLARFSPLHDIGKVGVRDGILLKPGKLTDEEFTEMKKHTDYGASVLDIAEQQMRQTGRSMFGIGIEIVSSHHEKWDGSGYPRGLSGYDIPLSARIVAIADVFDALTSKRPYKEAYAFSTAVQIMQNGCGSHFDPQILDIFLSDLVRLEEAYKAIQEKSQNLTFERNELSAEFDN